MGQILRNDVSCHEQGQQPGGIGPHALSCASGVNMLAPFPLAGVVPGHVRRSCTRNDVHCNGKFYRVCVYCVASIRAQPWSQTMYQSVTTNPSRLPANAEERAAAPGQPLRFDQISHGPSLSVMAT